MSAAVSLSFETQRYVVNDAYQSFLEAKIRIAEASGIDVLESDINPALKRFNQKIVGWALRGGCRGIFASFGLHKTVTNLEIMRLVGVKTPCFRLIVLPLGVKQEFFADAAEYFTGEYSIRLKFIQSTSEIDDQDTIFLTNYESVRDGKIDVSGFGAISLDEADCLRSFGSKTFGEFLFGPMQEIPIRFVFTATPSPNEFLELIAYAHFLGVMDMGEAKTRFFKRNSEKADKLTLHPHKVREFWLWVASWAIFVSRPSDLGDSDEGYVLPALDIHWHEVETDHSTAGSTKRGQGKLLKDAAIGVTQAASEKRSSLGSRVAKYLELRELDPDAHRIVWHDLEDERRAIEAAVPSVVSVYGSQKDEAKEAAINGFRHGTIAELAAKPSMLGGGCNFQRHCSWAIFLGIGFKFRDFIQGVHRLQRFGQKNTVRLDLIYTEAETTVRAELERKWKQHDEMVANLSEIIREYGLSESAMASSLTRTLGVARVVEEGDEFRLARNDSVLECQVMEENSVGLICTSIPFSSQYEYTPSYNDFGHTDGAEHFFEQMSFLSPGLFKVLKPGRVMAVHVKDRVVPGAMTGLGFQSVDPFHADCITHFKKFGFVYGGMITVVTDVVRENNQTYRLGWTEQCKDGSRMGVGMPEYILIFRKPPTDSSNGYSDEKVVKTKAEYSVARWQIDAHGFWRSDGNRLLIPEEYAGLRRRQIWRKFKAHSANEVYDYEAHVAVAELLSREGELPTDFMLLPPQSCHPDVWADVIRMRSLNSELALQGREKHICPLPFDIVRRCINRWSSVGDVVYDPFSGVGTVPLCSLELGRIGWGSELNSSYWSDSVSILRKAESKKKIPTLLDFMQEEDFDPCEPAGLA